MTTPNDDQLERADLAGMSPEAIVRARSLGLLDDLLHGKAPEPAPRAPEQFTRPLTLEEERAFRRSADLASRNA